MHNNPDDKDAQRQIIMFAAGPVDYERALALALLPHWQARGQVRGASRLEPMRVCCWNGCWKSTWPRDTMASSLA